MQYAPEAEQETATRLVDAALKRGWSISVWEGEGWLHHNSTDRAAILDDLDATEEATLVFYHGTRRVGSVLLYWGNGEDLISDHSDTMEIEVLVKELQP